MNAPAKMPARLLTPDARKPRAFPRVALFAFVVAVLVSLPIRANGDSPYAPIDVLCKLVAALSACSMAVWAEDRFYTRLARRRRPLRILVAVMFPFTGGLFMLLGGIALGALATLVHDTDGTVMISMIAGAWWLASAAAGSAVIVMLDMMISAVVHDFRSRVQLAVLSLILLVAGGSLVVFALGFSLGELGQRLIAEGKFAGRIHGKAETVQRFTDWLAQPESSTWLGLGFALIAMFAGIPALLSACGKLADAVMERLHPLAIGFEEVSSGRLDVRVEEAGSRDFVKISAGFNRMAGSLERTLGDLAETNRAAVRFVPEPFLQLLQKGSLKDIQRGDQIALDISVSFSDIRDFTTMAEAMGAAATFALVNRYIAAVEPEIHRRGGFINDIMGDGIMALFHQQDGRAADASVQAAIAHLAALERFNEGWVADGGQPLRVGIGINSGPLMLGTIGGSDRLSCTVIGDPVNFASRIEGMTKLYGAALLISEHTRARLANPDAYAMREVDRVQAKGKHIPARIFELLDPLPPAERDEKRATREAFAAALAAYRAGEIDKARRAFEECVKLAPSDRAAALYVDRCDRLLEHGLPSEWDGVTRFTTK
jgi:class 3 adenylate cyclase